MCCTHWASTRSACPPSSTRCRRARIRAPGPRPTSSTSAVSSAGSGSATTRGAASPPPTSTSTSGRSGSSCRSTTRGSTATSTGPGRIDELIAEFESGQRSPDDGRQWSALSAAERADVIDSHRLVYRADSMVNWCPGLGTVLANEEVTSDGRSDRGNFPVFRKRLRQWMMRITAYSDRLLDDLDVLDWPDKVKAMQRNWIGRSTGAAVLFGTDAGDIEVFTTRPDTLFGATYMVLAPEHRLVDAADRGRSGPTASTRGGPTAPRHPPRRWPPTARRSRRSPTWSARRTRPRPACSSAPTPPIPSTAQRIPVFIADYVLVGYGTGAIMAVPGGDQRDWDFATEFGLPIVEVVAGGDVSQAAYNGDGDDGELRLPRRAERRVGQGGRDRAAGGRRPRHAPASSTSCGTGCSPGSATGASRSRSSTTRTAARTRCRNPRCRSNCPTSRTTRRCSSTPTTPTASRRRRWARRPTG